MTTGHSEQWICVGTNEDTNRLSDFGEEKMKTVENIDSVIRNVFSEAVKAAEHKLYLTRDTVFFLVNKENMHDMNYVIGDVDNILYPIPIQMLQNSRSLISPASWKR